MRITIKYPRKYISVHFWQQKLNAAKLPSKLLLDKEDTHIFNNELAG